MDLLLTFSLIILHHATLYFCKPLSERPAEENTFEKDNYDVIAELLKNFDKENVKNIHPYSYLEQTSLGDRKNVLHMIQVIQKEGITAPVALILTPAGLAADLTNEYENKQEVQIAESENHIDKSNKTLNSQNLKELLASNEDSKHRLVKVNLPIETITPEENLQKQADYRVNNKQLIKFDEITKGESPLDESKIPIITETISNEGKYNIFGSKYNKDKVIKDFMYEDENEGEEDLLPNNSGNNDEIYQNHNNNDNTDPGLYYAEENPIPELVLEIEESNEETNKYSVFGSVNHNLTLVKKINLPKETILKSSSELRKRNSHEDFTDDELTLLQDSDGGQQNSKNAGNLFEEPFKRNYLEVKHNETEIPVPIIHEINTICKEEERPNRKLRNTKLDIRSYKFVFNR